MSLPIRDALYIEQLHIKEAEKALKGSWKRDLDVSFKPFADVESINQYIKTNQNWFNEKSSSSYILLPKLNISLFYQWAETLVLKQSDIEFIS